MIWRVVTSEPTRGQSYYEIVEHWTLGDLDDANCVLDAIENVHVRRAAEEKRRQTASAPSRR